MFGIRKLFRSEAGFGIISKQQKKPKPRVTDKRQAVITITQQIFGRGVPPSDNCGRTCVVSLPE
jgi:hypothetical protein